MTATATTTAPIEAAPHPAPPAEASLTVMPVGGATDRCAWEAYVRHAAAGTIFHEPGWSDAVEQAFGHRGQHLLAWRGARPAGVLPLVEVNSLFGGRLLSSVPYGVYGGILADDDETVEALAGAAIRLVHERRARVLDLRSARACVSGLERVDRYDTYVRELPPDRADLERFLPRHARAAARQAAQREGAEVRHDRNQLYSVWELYTRSMRRLGTLNYPYRFFADLATIFGERAWVTTVWQRRRLVAGVFSLVFRDTVMPYVVGADERVRCYGSRNLLYLGVMERAVEAGLRRFDFGRSRRDNSGSAGFKRNQGFTPQRLEYQRYVPPGLPAPDLTPGSRRFATAQRIWPHLPLFLTRPLGAWLSRSLPG